MKVIHGTTVPSVLAFFEGLPRFLKRNGFEVAVWSSPGPELDRFLECEECEGYPVQMLRAISPLRDVWACAKLMRLFWRMKPDIVHAHTPKAGLLGMLAAGIAQVPVRIYHIHGFPFMTAKGLKRKLLWLTERMSSKLASHVIAVGPGMRQVAIEEGICESDKIKILHNGTAGGIDAVNRFCPALVKPHVVEAIRKQLSLPREARVIGFIGRLARDKGVLELVEAWRILAANDPLLHLVLVGGLDVRDGIPAKNISEWKVTPRIHAVGHVDDVVAWYRLFDLLALPTYREGFGNVILEAAAMQVPVIASRIPGCSDAVIDGVTGTLVEVRNASELARAMRRYLDDPELRKQHGAAGRKRVLRDYVPEDMFQCILAEYNAILAGRSAAAGDFKMQDK